MAISSEQKDFSFPIVFDLAKELPGKTIDVGRNGTSASSDPWGSILQLSTYHPEHGIIVAAPYEQFDGTRYYDPTYVREYRTRMLQMIKDRERGFGLCIEGTQIHNSKLLVQHRSMDVAILKYQLDNGADVQYKLELHSNGEISQQAVVSNSTNRSVQVNYVVGLNISVHRASYGQLTEGGPLPLPACENELKVHRDDNFFSISNPFLDAHLQGRADIDGQRLSLVGVPDSAEAGVVSSSLEGLLVIPPSSNITLSTQFLLVPGRLKARCLLQDSLALASQDIAELGWVDAETCENYIIRRNVDYILGNCCIPVSNTEVCMITDHVALPLGWNRDNYWQWRLLLIARHHINRLVKPEAWKDYIQAMDRVIKGHLNWVFRRAERPHGFWHRSYLTTGKPKDGTAFQLDQQCYPLLELCDYLQEHPTEKRFVRDLMAESTATDILNVLWSKRDPVTGLFPTDETPGDDAVDYPFHFSSHVLLWYTLERVAGLLVSVGSPPGLSAEMVQSSADAVRKAALNYFLTVDTENSRSIFAYLTDAQGFYTFYHDANDIPTVFAKKWGFVSSPEELDAWQNTMAFATTAANEAGFSLGGTFSGLGSVHTSGPWPLGYFQELMYARDRGDKSKERDAARRIRGSAQWDGTFGEAVDVKSGVTTSKAWFSWPGSMIGALLIEEDIALSL